MDAAFALLQIDGIRRQIPVHDGVAPSVEVESFLTDRRRSENERAKRRVEGGAHYVDTGKGLVAVVLELAEAQREPAADVEVVPREPAPAVLKPVLVDANLSSADRERARDRLGRSPSRVARARLR